MKHLRYLAFAALLLAAPPMLAGCDTVADIFSQTGGSTTPSQVRVLSEAVNAATVATRVAEGAVRAGKYDTATLEQLRGLNNAVQAALHRWQAAADQNNSVYAASFNAALQAFAAFRATKGIGGS